jgi:hypothetical protein
MQSDQVLQHCPSTCCLTIHSAFCQGERFLKLFITVDAVVSVDGSNLFYKQRMWIHDLFNEVSTLCKNCQLIHHNMSVLPLHQLSLAWLQCLGRCYSLCSICFQDNICVIQKCKLPMHQMFCQITITWNSCNVQECWCFCVFGCCLGQLLRSLLGEVKI